MSEQTKKREYGWYDFIVWCFAWIGIVALFGGDVSFSTLSAKFLANVTDASFWLYGILGIIGGWIVILLGIHIICILDGTYRQAKGEQKRFKAESLQNAEDNGFEFGSIPECDECECVFTDPERRERWLIGFHKARHLQSEHH